MVRVAYSHSHLQERAQGNQATQIHVPCQTLQRAPCTGRGRRGMLLIDQDHALSSFGKRQVIYTPNTLATWVRELSLQYGRSHVQFFVVAFLAKRARSFLAAVVSLTPAHLMLVQRFACVVAALTSSDPTSAPPGCAQSLNGFVLTGALAKLPCPSPAFCPRTLCISFTSKATARTFASPAVRYNHSPSPPAPPHRQQT